MNKLLLLAAFLFACCPTIHADVDASTLRHKVMCGYQGWFNCPDDRAKLGWSSHWSKTPVKLTPETVNVEYWPDMNELGPDERFAAPGFTYPDGKPAELFSSHNAKTVERHFEWMQQYGIDGVWLQRFAVGLKGGPSESHYDALLDVLHYVRDAANRTGRVWALSYDISQMPGDKIYDSITGDWKTLVDREKITADPHYVHEDGLPVVQLWGLYANSKNIHLRPEITNRLFDFFDAPGPYHALFIGGGDWDWRNNPDPAWQKVFRRFKVYVPWNIGNVSNDANHVSHAATHYWADDRKDCESRGALWIPTVYAGFSWNNLMSKPWGTVTFPRRGGNFLWEQFHTLSQMGGIDTIYLAMFDEVDEGTAIFKITNTPPTQAHFLTYDGLPSDWYMRLVGEGEKRLREGTPVPAEIPIKP